jgi:hypothetical protein
MEKRLYIAIIMGEVADVAYLSEDDAQKARDVVRESDLDGRVLGPMSPTYSVEAFIAAIEAEIDIWSL